MAASSVFNFNVGVLGHVDSGKTSLSKALSTVASTASFDKNPQSKERGITLDLGFSSFQVDIPQHLQTEKFNKLQFTLVDCPGHASLIRTIIGGAQIIDLMMLVIDVTKGMQTQTAECLVIGEIACPKMVVVLNKVDLLPEAKREVMIEKMTKRMLKTLESTRFAGCPIIPVAAKPGGPEAPETDAVGVSSLIDSLSAHTYIPQRNPEGPFIFSVDHCFSIRGQGTVMTGTAVSGSAAVNDTVEIPSLKVTKKVKSIQMFKKPVERIIQGDRAGICVTQFDPKLLERGLVSTPGELPTIEAAIISIHKIGYFKGNVANKAKFHITTGHETVMGKIFLFGCEVGPDEIKNIQLDSSEVKKFDFSKEYSFCEELFDKGGAKERPDSSHGDSGGILPMIQYALIEFEKPVTCPKSCLVIGSKLDTDIHANTCRLAFHGHLLETTEDPNYRKTWLPKLKVFKYKTREGLVERVMDDYTIIGKNLFKKESNIQAFVGLKVFLSSGEQGVMEGGFGQSGKFKIRIPTGVSPSTKERYAGVGKKKGKPKPDEAANHVEALSEPIKIVLRFKRYVYDPDKKMIQT